MPQTIQVNQLALLLRLCVLIGFPCVAAFSTLVPIVKGDASIFYRAIVLLLAVSLLAVAFKRFRANVGFVMVLLFLALYFLRLIFDTIALDLANVLNSLLFYVGLVLLPVTAVLVCGVEHESDEHLARLLVKMGILLMFFFIWIWLTGAGYNAWKDDGVESDRLSLDILNSISVGQSAVTVLLGALALLLYFNVRGTMRTYSIIAIIAAFIVLYAANSRGPIVSAALATLWMSFGRLRRSWVLLLVFAGTLAYLFLYTDALDIVLRRFDLALLVDSSNQERLILQKSAINAFIASPVVGAFSVDISLPSGSYPHNLFIETAMALGLVGLSLLAILLLYTASRVMRFYNTEHPLLTGLLVQYFIAIQFSGSIFGADNFFMLLGLAATTRRSTKRVPKNIVNKITQSRSMPELQAVKS